MKCKACLPLIGEYVDGELSPRLAERVSAHLNACLACAGAYENIRHEQEVYSVYGREFEITPTLRDSVWARIAEEKITPIAGPFTTIRNWFVHSAVCLRPAGTAAIALIVLVIIIAGLANYMHTTSVRFDRDIATRTSEMNRPQPGAIEKTAPRSNEVRLDKQIQSPDNHSTSKTSKANEMISSARDVARGRIERRNRERKLLSPEGPAREAARNRFGSDQLTPEIRPLDAGKFRDPQMVTLEHIEKSQVLLRFFRNSSFFQGAYPDDLAYEKQQSQKLLRRNILLRCEAIAKGNLPEEELLSSLEPILLDIANLPERASPEDVRSIREMIKESEIVAALQVYSRQNTATAGY